MDKRVIYVGGFAALVGAYFFLRKNKSDTSNVSANAPTSITPANVPVQGVTDSSGNLLPQFTWPYNQLALPYNYSSNNQNGVTYTNPMQQTFVGYDNTPVS